MWNNLFILQYMNELVVDGAFNWTVAWSFLCCVLLVVSSVAILYIRDNREKQKLYKLFAGHMANSSSFFLRRWNSSTVSLFFPAIRFSG